MRDWAVMVRQRPERPPDVAAVPYGFSWGALVFQVLWALWRGAWLTAAVLFAALVLVALALEASGLDAAGRTTVELAAAVTLAFAAQDLRRFELARRRFRLVDIVSARSADEAELKALAGLVDEAGDQTGEDGGISSPRGLQPLPDRSM